MGNGPSGAPKLKRQWTSNQRRNPQGGDVDGFARYNERELTLLDRMFQDLARRSPNKTMSKETFLDYFALPGILGERLFSVFDTKKNGVIDFEEFVNGLARYNRGSMKDKIDMLFELYDLDGQAYVTREELSIILFSLITPTTALFFDSNSVEKQKNENDAASDNAATKSGLMYEDNKLTHVSKITRNTVEKLVQEAFEHCDTDKSGTLSKDQFEAWIKMNPSVINALETVFVKHVWSGFEEDDTIAENEAEMKENPTLLGHTKSRSSMRNIEPHNSSLRLDSPRSNGNKLRPSGVANMSQASLQEIAKPLQSIPPHFQPLYQQLQEAYVEDSMRDEHEAFKCRTCKFKFYKSMYVDDTSDPEFGKYVLFKQEASVNSNTTNFNNIVLKFCPQCGKKLLESSVKMSMNLQSAMELTADLQKEELFKVGKAGNMFKLGAKFHTWVQRYYVIKDKFLYSFKKKDDETPTNVMFISGWFIAACDDQHAAKGYYGIELQPPHMGDQPKPSMYANSNTNNDYGGSDAENTGTNGGVNGGGAGGGGGGSNESKENENSLRKVLYCRSAEDRNQWILALQYAASTIAIENDYSIGKVLGKGHFSVVHLGTHKETNENFAIKIVEKKRIDAREKMALRNEIAIMKLVNHPCIIKMEDVYEDKKCIYMVMTLVKYGDFFGRWQSKKNFKEDTIRIIIWKLLDALHYLHGLGIVHRDLKPENILCTSETDDTQLLISDFGLSKFAAPHTEMTMSCGTLAYVAPEVLKQKGYSKKVDLWSLGCIMHLLIRNVLPFDGRTKEQVIERTLNKKLDLETKPVWKTITPEAKNLLAKLLEKDPNQRIDLPSAIAHPWFDKIRYDKQYSLHKKVSADLKALTSVKSLPSSPLGSNEATITIIQPQSRTEMASMANSNGNNNKNNNNNNNSNSGNNNNNNNNNNNKNNNSNSSNNNNNGKMAITSSNTDKADDKFVMVDQKEETDGK